MTNEYKETELTQGNYYEITGVTSTGFQVRNDQGENKMYPKKLFKVVHFNAKPHDSVSTIALTLIGSFNINEKEALEMARKIENDLQKKDFFMAYNWR